MQFISDTRQAIITISYSTLLIVGALMEIFDKEYAYIVFGVGGLIAIIQSFMYAYQHKTTDIRISRLHRINFMTTLILGIGTYMMYVGSNSWVAMLILFVVLQIFLVIRWKE